MQVIRESSEHHFLTTLEQRKNQAKGWVAAHFALSKKISHAALIKDLTQIGQKIKTSRTESETLLNELEAKLASLPKAFLYLFPDNDIVMLALPQSDEEKKLIHRVYQEFDEKLGKKLSDTGLLANEMYVYQKLADQKMVAATRFEAYKTMSDKNKVSSITVRRERRDDPAVLLIEDDRFTASYTANLLNKDYELFVCKNGEDGIKQYIEAAPDIVLLDIHLPGLSGHETLEAIKAVDPDAFVVMLSVDTVRNSIVKATEIGAKSFLKKPFSKERLINTIKTSPFISGIVPPEGESLH